MADKITAPFTPEQVKKLEEWQTGSIHSENRVAEPLRNFFKGGRPVHPFTCCSHDDCKRSEQPNEGALIPSEEGWICPCGKYRQNWCHDFMVNR